MDKVDREYMTYEEALEAFRNGEDVWYETGDEDEDGNELNTCWGLQYGDTEEDLKGDYKFFHG